MSKKQPYSVRENRLRRRAEVAEERANYFAKRCMELEADARRIGWLEKNLAFELKLTQGDGMVHVDRWFRRYVSYHAFTGPTLRAAIDEAIRVTT